MKKLVENGPYPSLASLKASKTASLAEKSDIAQRCSTPTPLTLIERARAYVAKIPAAVSGSGGHDATFAVAKALVHDFGLAENAAMVLMEEYNVRCQPHWSPAELRHKLASAARCDRAKRAKGELSQDYVSPRPVKRLVMKREIRPPKILGRIALPASVEHPACPTPLAVTAPVDTAEDIEVKRIAGELSKLHRNGAISGPNDAEAVFYACLIRDFGATYTRRLEE
jgi:hypothetical protein